MRAPPHDERLRQPFGLRVRPKGALIHCTVSYPRPGPTDRYGIIDYLAGKGLTVPVCTDDEASTAATPLGYLGNGHGACLTGKAWGIEIIGQASWSRKEWLRHRESVRQAAEWGAWVLAELMDLPVTVRNRKRFIVGHDQDYKLGGCSDHWDPGPGFPWDVFDECLMEAARVKGYRVVATRDDERKVRDFLPARRARMKQFIRKHARRGWKIAKRETWLIADLD